MSFNLIVSKKATTIDISFGICFIYLCVFSCKRRELKRKGKNMIEINSCNLLD
jgi:hypothetical protein